MQPVRPALAVIAGGLLLLAACGKGADQPPGKVSAAQVLPGTASDAMIDLDRSHAQPLLQPVPRTRGVADDTASDEADDAAADVPPVADAPAN